jgi:hypothetical protein
MCWEIDVFGEESYFPNHYLYGVMIYKQPRINAFFEKPEVEKSGSTCCLISLSKLPHFSAHFLGGCLDFLVVFFITLHILPRRQRQEKVNVF